jgi:hypothetical protein
MLAARVVAALCFSSSLVVAAEPVKRARDPLERALEGLGRAGGAPSDRGGTVPAGEELRWDAAAEDGPFVARVNDDDTDDVIGRYRLGSGPSETAWVGAFDGRTRARLWKIGPLPTNGAVRAVRVAVAGNRVLVTDGAAMARVHARATGALVGEARLSAPARRVCAAPPASAPAFYVVPAGAVDGVYLDGAGRPVAGARRPAWCPIVDPLGVDTECWRHAFHAHAHAPCVSSSRAPQVPGARTEFVIDENGLAVVVGAADGGERSGQPILAGVDLAARRLTWTRRFDDARLAPGAPDLVEVEEGAVFAYLPRAAGGGELVALDGRRGTERFRVAVPRSEYGAPPTRVVIAGGRVYLPHGPWLDLFDGASGAVIDTIGRW